MELYFARVSLIHYIGAGLWIAAPAVVVLLVLGMMARKSRLGTIIVGILLVISSIPIALMSEVSINGCCGAPSGSYQGAGYVIGAIIALLGISILIFGQRLVKKKSAK